MAQQSKPAVNHPPNSRATDAGVGVSMPMPPQHGSGSSAPTAVVPNTPTKISTTVDPFPPAV